MRETPADRMRVAFELYDLAVEMIRARVRRERPEATKAEIEAEVHAWLRERPGAEHGDGEGTPRPWRG